MYLHDVFSDKTKDVWSSHQIILFLLQFFLSREADLHKRFFLIVVDSTRHYINEAMAHCSVQCSLCRDLVN